MKLAKFIRTITVAPLLALVLLLVLYGVMPEVYGETVNFVCSILFLVVMPILAYPLQPLIPGFKDKGRDGQRNLAIVMAVVGYVAAVIYGICVQLPAAIWLIYLTYFLSGLGIVLFNKAVKIKASGHACGVVGPLSLMVYLIGASGIPGFLLIIPVYWASLKAKRHTIAQLISGSVIPVASLGLSILLVRVL